MQKGDIVGDNPSASMLLIHKLHSYGKNDDFDYLLFAFDAVNIKLHPEYKYDLQGLDAYVAPIADQGEFRNMAQLASVDGLSDEELQRIGKAIDNIHFHRWENIDGLDPDGFIRCLIRLSGLSSHPSKAFMPTSPMRILIRAGRKICEAVRKAESRRIKEEAFKKWENNRKKKAASTIRMRSRELMIIKAHA